MRKHIDNSSHTGHQDNPLTRDFMDSPNASLKSNDNIDSIDSENNPLAVDNEMRGSLSDTLSDRNLLPISTSDTLSDRNLLWSWLFDASLNWYQEDLDREYESYQQTSKVRLNEVRREAEEAYTSDNTIDPIPKTAYNDALVLLEGVFRAGIPMPEFSWAEDGSLSLTWFLKGGLATMGLYGDNIVIYSVFFEEKRQAEGICELSDTPMLSGFLVILSNILSK